MILPYQDIPVISQSRYIVTFNKKDFRDTEHISINQFVISAVIEKLTALDTEKYIENHGLRGSKEKYINVLKKAPHVQPRQDDVIKG